MKRSKLYKGFIPINYTKRQEVLKNIGNKRGMVYLIIINIILLPINVKTLIEFNSKKVDSKDISIKTNYNMNKDGIIKSLKLLDYNIEYLISSEIETQVTTMDKSLIYKLNNNDFNINRVDIEDEEIKITIKDE